MVQYVIGTIKDILAYEYNITVHEGVKLILQIHLEVIETNLLRPESTKTHYVFDLISSLSEFIAFFANFSQFVFSEYGI